MNPIYHRVSIRKYQERPVENEKILHCQRLKTEYSGGDARWGHTRSHPEHDG